MMRSAFVLSVLCCTFSASVAQEIGSLLPWLQLPDRVKIGMSAESLHELYPFLQGSTTGQEFIEGDLLFDKDRKIHKSEGVAFGIRKNALTKFYWTSQERISPEAVNTIRALLQRNFGTPKVGYKARLTKNGIAKITTEVYHGNGNDDIVISLSSALQVTELAVIDLNAEGVSGKELYFSYEDQKNKLRFELARLTGKMPEEEEPSKCADVLAALITGSDDDQKKTPREHRSDLNENNQELPATSDEGDIKTNEKDSAMKEEKELKSPIRLPLIIAGILLVGILAFRLKTLKGKPKL